MNFKGNASRPPQFIVISDDDQEKTMNKHGQQQPNQQHIPYTCTVCMKKFDTFQALISHHYQNLFHKMTASTSSQGCFNQETQQGSDSKSKIHLPQLDYVVMKLPQPTTCTMIESQPVTTRIKVENPKANVPRPTVTMTQSQTQPVVTMTRSQTQPQISVTCEVQQLLGNNRIVKKTRDGNPERENFDLNVGYEANVTTNHPGGIYQVKRALDNQKIDLNLRL